MSWIAYFYLLLLVLCWAYIAAWAWRKKQVGRVLLDLGRPKLYRVNLVGGGLIAGLLLVRDLLGMEDELEFEEISRILCLISFGVFILLLGLSHSAIRAYGILHIGLILKWQKLESYKWEGKDQLTLTVRVKRVILKPLLPSWPLGLDIPSVDKDIINNLVAEHVPSAATEETNST